VDGNYLIKGLIFFLLGISIVCYVVYQRRKKKSYNDWKGVLGGFGAVLFGLYLIFESFTNQF
jgi:uncharacterized membrane protein HdeD (DUF308 family)